MRGDPPGVINSVVGVMGIVSSVVLLKYTVKLISFQYDVR